jgi:hypothetical protein
MATAQVGYSRWTLTLKNFGIIALKNAVNVLIVNSAAWWILPANFNFHNSAAMWNIAKLAGGVILGKEASVFIPKLLAWSQTNTDGTAACTSVSAAQAEAKAPSKP